MLRKIGFQYAERIDPFDGGPHFIARTVDLKLVQSLERADVVAVDQVADTSPRGIIAAEHDRPPRFLACAARYRLEGGHVGIAKEVQSALAVAPGEAVWVQPSP